MMKNQSIVGLAGMLLLVVSFALSLGACGQKGVLVLPKEPATQSRATLPQVLNTISPTAPAASAPAVTPAR